MENQNEHRPPSSSHPTSPHPKQLTQNPKVDQQENQHKFPIDKNRTPSQHTPLPTETLQ